MFFPRARRTLSSWIALLAILVVTLAPAVTGALSASRTQLWDELCSATTTAGNDAPAGPHAFGHCPYCALHADLAPPPDPRVADAGIALAFRASPVAFTRAPRSNGAWAFAQPRAPPRFV